MPHRKVIAKALEEQRDEMVKYAGAVSGDNANAEDLVQEAWMRCDRAAQVQPVAKPTNLLWRVLRNLSIDRGRRIAHEARTIIGGQCDHFVDGLGDDQPSIEDMLIARSELAAVQRVLDRLDTRTRQAFEMHRFEGTKLREIAARLNISITTAHGLVATAMRVINEAIPRD